VAIGLNASSIEEVVSCYSESPWSDVTITRNGVAG
jgi:hypothetical protein